MALTKNPLIRYKLLDKYFRNPYKKYYFETLLEDINQELYEITGVENGIKTRQLRDDIAFMRSSEGWSIELAELAEGKKKIYRYEDLNFSINNFPLNEVETNQFESAILVLSQFEGMHQFEGIQEIIAKLKSNFKVKPLDKPFIGFDSSQDLVGIEHLTGFYNAVQNKIPLEITYKGFYFEEERTFVFHPYYLKQYNNRWFLFGFDVAKAKPNHNVPIDRVISFSTLNIPFIANDNIDWQEYFSDMIGVSKPENENIEEVILNFNQITGKYLESKSIHETQKNKWIDQNTLEVSLKVYINYELERLILSYCESVTVIKPLSLQKKIYERLKKNLANYEW